MKMSESQISNTCFQFISNFVSHKQERRKTNRKKTLACQFHALPLPHLSIMPMMKWIISLNIDSEGLILRFELKEWYCWRMWSVMSYGNTGDPMPATMETVNNTNSVLPLCFRIYECVWSSQYLMVNRWGRRCTIWQRNCAENEPAVRYDNTELTTLNDRNIVITNACLMSALG